MKAYGYVRFSHADSRKGMSEADQVDRIREFHAKSLAHATLVMGEETTDREVSAFKNRFVKRQAGSFVNSHLKRGDALVLAYYDRGFRKLWDALWTIELWQKRGVAVYILDYPGADLESFAGFSMLVMGAWMSEGHSRRLSERMKSAYATRRKYDLTQSGGARTILPGFKTVRIQNRDLGTDTTQALFDEKQLPFLKRCYDLVQAGQPFAAIEKLLTLENCRAMGAKENFAFAPEEARVERRVVKQASLVWEFIQPYLEAKAYISHTECREFVTAGMKVKTARYSRNKAK